MDELNLLKEKVKNLEMQLGGLCGVFPSLCPSSPSYPTHTTPHQTITIEMDDKWITDGTSGITVWDIDKKHECYVETHRVNNILWGWVFIGTKEGPGYIYEIAIKNVKGYTPVTASFNEWNNEQDNINKNSPKIGNARFYTFGVEREKNGFRVSGTHSFQEPKPFAIGFMTII